MAPVWCNVHVAPIAILIATRSSSHKNTIYIACIDEACKYRLAHNRIIIFNVSEKTLLSSTFQT